MRHGADPERAAGAVKAAAARFAQGLGFWSLLAGPVLAWRPHALRLPQLWLVVGLSLLANVLQPSYRLLARKPCEDHGTFLQIILTVYLTQLLAVLELAARGPRSFPFGATCWIALGAMLGGLALRTWAVATLGRFFTLPVAVSRGQPVIDRGPYRLIRHPSYLGALVAFVASCVLLGSWIAAVVAAVALSLAFLAPDPSRGAVARDRAARLSGLRGANRCDAPPARRIPGAAPGCRAR
jgi:protein-S-isoprenylcysteine O-methyltransferase